jgi:hypothetical protein
MIICCNKEMKVEKNGVGVETNGCVYPGDRYVCLACRRTVIKTASISIPDPQHEMFSEYVVLK